MGLPRCSQVVDYAKNGNSVEIHNNLPKPLIKFKPDWHKAEVTGARELDYYVSERALGMCSGTSSSSIRKNLSKDYPQNPDSESENGHAERLHDHYVLDAVHMHNAHPR